MHSFPRCFLRSNDLILMCAWLARVCSMLRASKRSDSSCSLAHATSARSRNSSSCVNSTRFIYSLTRRSSISVSIPTALASCSNECWIVICCRCLACPTCGCVAAGVPASCLPAATLLGLGTTSPQIMACSVAGVMGPNTGLCGSSPQEWEIMPFRKGDNGLAATNEEDVPPATDFLFEMPDTGDLCSA
jgi:hypothetical protein